MRAYWLPSLAPDAGPVRHVRPDKHAKCPLSGEKLSLKVFLLFFFPWDFEVKGFEIGSIYVIRPKTKISRASLLSPPPPSPCSSLISVSCSPLSPPATLRRPNYHYSHETSSRTFSLSHSVFFALSRFFPSGPHLGQVHAGAGRRPQRVRAPSGLGSNFYGLRFRV